MFDTYDSWTQFAAVDEATREMRLFAPFSVGTKPYRDTITGQVMFQLGSGYLWAKADDFSVSDLL